MRVRVCVRERDRGERERLAEMKILEWSRSQNLEALKTPLAETHRFNPGKGNIFGHCWCGRLNALQSRGCEFETNRQASRKLDEIWLG